MLNGILVVLCLIATSAFFPISEILLAVSRKVKLKLLTDEGNINTQRVLKMQENPGMFFTVVQIGLNAVVILGSIVGDATFSPAFYSLFLKCFTPELSEQLSFILSLSLVTDLFILFADLTPRRIGMITSEAMALRVVSPMRFRLLVSHPLMQFFNGLANSIFRLFKIPMVRRDDIILDDTYAVVGADALTGVLRKQEHELTENVFELESRTVPSSMTSREDIIWFDLHEDEQSLKSEITEHPRSKFLVYSEDIDHTIGYANPEDLLNCVLTNQNMALDSSVQICNTLIVPDALTLSGALESFETVGEDFAVIMNEYALVVGIIALNDVMTTLMGDLVGQDLEEQIMARDENSWLINGGTPIDDVMRMPGIDEFPQSGNYKAISGFMMFMLRKIPKRTDSVKYSGYRFEVVNTSNYKIDQLLVMRLDSKPTALVPRPPDAKEEAKVS